MTYTQSGYAAYDDVDVADDEPRSRTTTRRYEPDSAPTGRAAGVPARAAGRPARAMRPVHEENDMGFINRRAAELAAPTGNDPQIAPGLKNQRPRRPHRQKHPLFFVGMGLFATILLWQAGMAITSWGASEYNMILYGNPRTFQIDAVVGHGDSAQHPSHFIAVNLHGQVSVLEYPAGDPGKVRQIAVMSLINQDQAVVTLAFVRVAGKLDLIIAAGGEQTPLVNDGKTFRNPTADEQKTIAQALAAQGGH
jgi:hypothetical protein